MNSGFYSAFAAFSSRTDALEMLANNVANASTVGFKASHAFYRSFDSWTQPFNATPINQAINHFGVLGGAHLDLSPGNLEPTGNDTDVALERSGFFTIQAANGIRYTRAGNFSLNAQRQLVTAQGDLVLGEQGPIQIPNGQLSISADGTISVGGVLVSKLKIADPAPTTQLTAEGKNYFIIPAAEVKPATTVSVRQGSLEMSNSDPVRSTVSIIELQRTAELMEKALSIFHNEFNRTAAQQIPTV
jgi:flagellar basal-body rod protein FlgF/flagellar basal-body rod protein FlgG